MNEGVGDGGVDWVRKMKGGHHKTRGVRNEKLIEDEVRFDPDQTEISDVSCDPDQTEKRKKKNKRKEKRKEEDKKIILFYFLFSIPSLSCALPQPMLMPITEHPPLFRPVDLTPARILVVPRSVPAPVPAHISCTHAVRIRSQEKKRTNIHSYQIPKKKKKSHFNTSMTKGTKIHSYTRRKKDKQTQE
jgi:hypothetical protein